MNISGPKRLSLALAAAAVVLAGCNGDPGGDPAVADDPAGALEDAVAAAEQWEGVRAVMTAQSDDWAAVAAAEGEQMPEGFAEAIDDATATLAVTFGRPFEIAFDTEVGGDLLMGVRFVEGQDLVTMVDLPAIRDMMDDQGERELDQMLGMAGMFGLSDVVRAFEDGEWVALVLPSDAVGDVADDQGLNEPFQELIDVLRTEGVEVEFVEADEDGDRLAVTVDPAQMAIAMGGPAPADAEVFVVDVWVVDGEISQIALDLSQLEDGLDEPVRFVAELEEFTGPVEVPDADTVFDVEEAFGGFGGGMGLDGW